MQSHLRPSVRTLVRTRSSPTGWVVGALLTSLGLAAASSTFAGALPGAWTGGSLVVLVVAAALVALVLRRTRRSD